MKLSTLFCARALIVFIFPWLRSQNYINYLASRHKVTYALFLNIIVLNPVAAYYQ